MITTLILYICTSSAMDDCQAHAWQQWEGKYAIEMCLASLEPTLDAQRREGILNAAARCVHSEP